MTGALANMSQQPELRTLPDDELDGDAIGLEMWERRGNNVLEAPWFSESWLA